MENNFDNPHQAQKYKGWYYRYLPTIDMWDFYTDFYSGDRRIFNARTWRIDQCFHEILRDEERS